MESGGLLYVSGAAPLDADGRPLTGKVGPVPLAEARRRAGLVAAALLASVAVEPGRIARLTRCLRLFGMVNAGPGFTGVDQVMAGAAEVLTRLLPPCAVTAVVLPALPNDITVEIEAVFALD